MSSRHEDFGFVINSLFEKWLAELRDAAASKELKSQYTYAKALHSLKKYPLPITSGKECKMLDGFGDKICQILDDKLIHYNRVKDLEGAEPSAFFSTSCSDGDDAAATKSKKLPTTSSTRRTTAQKSCSSAGYVPKKNSGSYAILLTLHRHLQSTSDDGNMLKKQLIEAAQPLCGQSFVVPEPGSRYTAWSSMGTLIVKGLVTKIGCPAKYRITDSGSLLAGKVLQAVQAENMLASGINVVVNERVTSGQHRNDKNVRHADRFPKFPVRHTAVLPEDEQLSSASYNTCIQESSADSVVPRNPVLRDDHDRKRLESSSSKSCGVNSTANQSPDVGSADCRLAAGEFNIILCVDNQEFYANTSRNREILVKELSLLGIRYDVRRLQVGDFLWIAQQTSPSDCDGDTVELVLDWIVERKRMDDLASSIMDGRFQEQKIRLLGCGVHNVIYLVEDYGSAQHHGLPEDTLQQAVINTQVTDGFVVKKTCDAKESAAFLALVTHRLQSQYSNKTLFGYQRHFRSEDETDRNRNVSGTTLTKLLDFTVFNESAVKTKALSVSEMFGKHLMQLYGLTPEKAAAVLKQYPTPSLLFYAYDKCRTTLDCDLLLSELHFGPTKRNFGSPLSRMVSMLYSTCGLRS